MRNRTTTARAGNSRDRNRGFSLVELMVALTGGLFVSVIVFALARQGTRFYQQETRVAEATLGATIGMQRLRADIGRAGYMSSRFIGNMGDSDPDLCMNYAGSSLSLLAKMRSIRIVADANVSTNNQDLTRAGITPDRIEVSGAYQNPDRFIAGYLQNNGTYLAVPLQPNLGAMARLGYLTLTAAGQDNLLASLFPAKRLLRLVNQYGRVAYGLINSVSRTGDPTGTLPTILLELNPSIPLQGAANSACVFSGVGVEVNVVNFFRYRIADLKKDAAYNSSYGQLYASTLSNTNPADANRTELIREELDPSNGDPFVGGPPPEIVAEYAVDLKFEGLVTPGVTAGQTSLALTPTAGNIYDIASIEPTGAPQRIRSLRARLSVRSRETDRNTNIPGAAPGLYRIAAGADATAFARVRTVQADIAIPNHFAER